MCSGSILIVCIYPSLAVGDPWLLNMLLPEVFHPFLKCRGSSGRISLYTSRETGLLSFLVWVNYPLELHTM